MSKSVAPVRVVRLHAIAHAHAGDKGNRCNISVIAYRPASFCVLLEQVTQERVASHFAYRAVSRVVRYELPRLNALNFVLDHALEGGVNRSLGLDGHGQSLAFHLLELPVSIAEDLRL